MPTQLLVFFLFLVGNAFVGIIVLAAVLRSRPIGPNRWLALLVGSLLLLNLEFSMRITGVLFNWPMIHRLTLPLIYALGPLLYFYVRAITGQQYRPQDNLHFLPAIAAFALIGKDTLEIPLLDLLHHAPREFYLVDVVLPFLAMGVYLTLSYIELRRYRTALKAKFSNLDIIRNTWLTEILGLFIIAVFLVAMREALAFTTIVFIPMPIGLTLLIMGISYLSLRHSQVIHWETEPNAAIKNHLSGKLSPRDISDWSARITHVLSEQRPYRNPDLNITDLAQMVGISEIYLGYVIEHSFHQNFSDLINSYRVNEILKRMNGDNLDSKSLMNLAKRYGFPSKAAFKTSFRQFTGKSINKYQPRTNRAEFKTVTTPR